MDAIRLIRWATNVGLCLAIMAFALFGIGPHSGQYRTLSILSDSMEPSFAAGDAIIATPMATRAVRTGDVISFHAPVDGKPLVTHRVVKVLRGGRRPIVQTRGDANSAIDPWTAELDDGIVWKQRATIPNVGHVTRALRHQAVKTATVYALPLLLLAMMLTAIWRKPTTHDAGEFALDEPAIEYAFHDSPVQLIAHVDDHGEQAA